MRATQPTAKQMKPMVCIENFVVSACDKAEAESTHKILITLLMNK